MAKGTKGHKGKGRLSPGRVSRALTPSATPVESEHTRAFTEAKKKAVLSYIELGNTIVYSCRLAGVERRTFYKHRDADPEFAAAVEEAYKAGIEMMEQEAFRRAMQGVDDYVMHEGTICYHTRPLLVPVYKDGKEVLDKDGNPVFETIHQHILDAEGHPIPIVKKRHSDQLHMFVMKSRDDKYIDKREVKTTPLEKLDTEQIREDFLARLEGMGGKITVSETRTVTVEAGRKGNGHGNGKTIEGRVDKPKGGNGAR